MYAHLRLRQVSYSNIRHIQCRVQKEVTVRWPLSLFSPTYNKYPSPPFTLSPYPSLAFAIANRPRTAASANRPRPAQQQ